MTKATCADSTGALVAHPSSAGAAVPAPATPSTARRNLLTGAAAALVAGAVSAVPLSAGAEPADPVVGLCRRWHEVETAAEKVHARLEAARLTMPIEGVRRIVRESDSLNADSLGILLAILAAPAASASGALAKLRVAAAVWPPTKPVEELDLDEELAIDAIRDAVRLLGESA